MTEPLSNVLLKGLPVGWVNSQAENVRNTGQNKLKAPNQAHGFLQNLSISSLPYPSLEIDAGIFQEFSCDSWS